MTANPTTKPCRSCGRPISAALVDPSCPNVPKPRRLGGLVSNPLVSFDYRHGQSFPPGFGPPASPGAAAITIQLNSDPGRTLASLAMLGQTVGDRYGREIRR